MNHYEARALEIAMAVWTGTNGGKEAFANANRWMKKAEDFASEHREGSYALLLDELPHQVGRIYLERNGNRVYAVIRRGKVVTTLLRRSNQDLSVSGFGVDEVVEE